MSGPDITKYVFEKQFECPLCEEKFAAPIARHGKSRLVSTDTDLKQNYEPFDPIAYDVVVCSVCGYAETVNAFPEYLHDKIKEALTKALYPGYAGRKYPMELTVDMALERFKTMILCNQVKHGKLGMAAYAHLKMAWVCRNAKDSREREYLALALKYFKEAFQKENPPIAGMDETAVSYLIGELERRTGDGEEALRWFGRVVSSKSVTSRIKEMALDQKNLIQQERRDEQEAAKAPATQAPHESQKRKLFPWSR